MQVREARPRAQALPGGGGPRGARGPSEHAATLEAPGSLLSEGSSAANGRFGRTPVGPHRGTPRMSDLQQRFLDADQRETARGLAPGRATGHPAFRCSRRARRTGMGGSAAVSMVFGVCCRSPRARDAGGRQKEFCTPAHRVAWHQAEAVRRRQAGAQDGGGGRSAPAGDL